MPHLREGIQGKYASSISEDTPAGCQDGLHCPSPVRVSPVGRSLGGAKRVLSRAESYHLAGLCYNRITKTLLRIGFLPRAYVTCGLALKLILQGGTPIYCPTMVLDNNADASFNRLLAYPYAISLVTDPGQLYS